MPAAHLSGIDHPAGEQDLIDAARDRRADEEALSTSERLPERQYDGPNAISAEVGNLD